MPVVTPDDVKTLQLAIGSETNALDAAYQACLPKLMSAPDKGQPLIDQWAAMKQRAFAFIAVTPSWLNTAAQMNDGQAIQRDLQPWHARLGALCANVPAAPAAPPPQADFLSTIGDDIKWVVLAFLAWQVFGGPRR